MNEPVLQRGYNVNIAVNESLKRHSRQSGSFIAFLILWLSSKSRIYVVYQTVVHVSSAIRMKEYTEQKLLYALCVHTTAEGLTGTVVNADKHKLNT